MGKCLIIILLLYSFFSCRERYNVPLTSSQTGYLVVEGFVSASGKSTINLSRTTPLAERSLLPEEDAVVKVEGEDNSVYELTNADSGRYVADGLPLNNDIKYRLHIQSRGKEYASDFRPVMVTPALDSVTWKRHSGGVEIFVNARDQQNKTKYYKWDYEETWEFRSEYPKYLNIVEKDWGNGPELTLEYVDSTTWGPDSSMLTCWKSRISTSILTGSTVKLAEDVVYLPINFYKEGAWELSRLYSIKVKQYALSKEGYEFYQKMKKNTEALGSIFDAQPSDIKGNIKCISSPEEVVIGFFDVASSDEKRIFISNEELPDWNYRSDCEAGIAVIGTVGEILREKIISEGRLPTIPIMRNGGLAGTYAAYARCVDCRMRGTSVKPPFWP